LYAPVKETSTDGFHDRSILDAEIAVALNPVGTDGPVISGVSTISFRGVENTLSPEVPIFPEASLDMTR
jgi:hypothetical protein